MTGQSQITVEEGNRLIAEFMGASWKTEEKMWSYHHLKNQPSPHHSKWWTTLLYHDSWDWLMPVVEKIRDMRMIKGAVLIQTFYWEAISEALMRAKQNEIYIAVVYFIQWYNSQK